MAFLLTIQRYGDIIVPTLTGICGDNMELDKLIETIREPLKNNGYKKKNTNWYKVCDTLSIVFNIQRSQSVSA